VSLEQIESDYQEDELLAHMRRVFIKYVPGEGIVPSRVMLVGEAPGKFENFHRRPFVGPAGKLLRELMSLAGLSIQTNSYITNVVKFRPVDERKNNRTPTLKEIKASMPYLFREWESIGSPEIIVPIGTVAMHELLPDNFSGIISVAGNVYSLDRYTVVPMVHPAYILRNESTIDVYRNQWRELGQFLREHS
jgi:uracil-DNA glycosylase family 4